LITVPGLITMVGSTTVVGQNPTVGQPKFPEATGHRAGVRVGHPNCVGHGSICALGGQIALKLGPQIGPPPVGGQFGIGKLWHIPHRLGAVGHEPIGGKVGGHCGMNTLGCWQPGPGNRVG
jgi:hypothetical protein